MSEFANEAMAEVYGRLTEALDMNVVYRERTNSLHIYNGYFTSIEIEAKGRLLFASGETQFGDVEIEAGAKRMAETIKNRIHPPALKMDGDDA